MVVLLLCPDIHWHTSGLTTNRWDRIVMVTTTRALPLSSQSRLRIRQTQDTHYSYLSRARVATVCDMLMLEIDLNKGEDNPPCLKCTRRGFPRPACKVSSVCALRCSGAAKREPQNSSAARLWEVNSSEMRCALHFEKKCDELDMYNTRALRWRPSEGRQRSSRHSFDDESPYTTANGSFPMPRAREAI